MTLDIGNPRIAEALQQAFQLQGRIRPVLEESVLPVVVLGDLGEGQAPATSRRATALINETATVGERFVMRFEMIPGTIGVVRQINLRASVDFTNFSWVNRGNAAVLGALATTAAKGFMDGRILPGSGKPQQPAGVLTTGTQIGALLGGVGQIDLGTEGIRYTIPGGGWVVGTGAPGLFGFLEFQIATNNILVEGSIEWDEYPLV